MDKVDYLSLFILCSLELSHVILLLVLIFHWLLLPQLTMILSPLTVVFLRVITLVSSLVFLALFLMLFIFLVFVFLSSSSVVPLL